MLTPTFHLMGVFSQLYTPITSGEAVALFAPQEPLPPIIPNPQNILEAAQATKCNSLSTVPVFLEVRIFAGEPSRTIPLIGLFSNGLNLQML